MTEHIPDEKPQYEVDLLKYKGSHIPLFIRIVWIVFITFFVVYLVRFSWPDIMEWMK